MEIGDIITLINQSGFPIVVALYSLIRLETTIKHNTQVIADMSTAIATMSAAIQTFKKGDN